MQLAANVVMRRSTSRYGGKSHRLPKAAGAEPPVVARRSPACKRARMVVGIECRLCTFRGRRCGITAEHRPRLRRLQRLGDIIPGYLVDLGADHVRAMEAIDNTFHILYDVAHTARFSSFMISKKIQRGNHVRSRQALSIRSEEQRGDRQSNQGRLRTPSAQGSWLRSVLLAGYGRGRGGFTQCLPRQGRSGGIELASPQPSWSNIWHLFWERPRSSKANFTRARIAVGDVCPPDASLRRSSGVFPKPEQANRSGISYHPPSSSL